MKQLKFVCKTLCVAASLCFALEASAQNLVKDSGFEASGNPTNPPTSRPFSAAWTINDPSGNQPPGVSGSNSNVGSDPGLSHSGNNYANLGFSPDANSGAATFGSLSQTLTTVAGRSYSLNFFLIADPLTTGTTNFFQAFFNGVMVYSTTVPPFPTNPGPAYARVFVAGLVATGSTSTLEFRYRNDGDFWRLDDISVETPEGGVPLWILGGVIGGCVLVRSRIRRAHAS